MKCCQRFPQKYSLAPSCDDSIDSVSVIYSSCLITCVKCSIYLDSLICAHDGYRKWVTCLTEQRSTRNRSKRNKIEIFFYFLTAYWIFNRFFIILNLKVSIRTSITNSRLIDLWQDEDGRCVVVYGKERKRENLCS